MGLHGVSITTMAAMTAGADAGDSGDVLHGWAVALSAEAEDVSSGRRFVTVDTGDLGTPTDTAFMGEVMAVAAHGGDGGWTASVHRCGDGRRNPLQIFYEDDDAHIPGRAGEGRTFELRGRGAEQFAQELIDVCHRRNPDCWYVRRSAR